MLNNRSSCASVLFPWEELRIKSILHLVPVTCGLRYEGLRTRWHRFAEDQMLRPGVVWSKPPANGRSRAKPNSSISLVHNAAAARSVSDRHLRAVEEIVSFTIHTMKELNPDPTAVGMLYGNVDERGGASARHGGRGRGGQQRGEVVALTPLAGLTTTLLEDCDESFAVVFAEETIPWMAMLVAKAPQLFEKGLPLLLAKDSVRNDDDEGSAESVILSEAEVATLLAMGFFSLFPFRTLPRTPMPFVADSDLVSDKMGSDFLNDEERSKGIRRTQPLEMPAFNFIYLHTINSPSSNAKLRCIMEYFKTMSGRNVGRRDQKVGAEVEREKDMSGKETDQLGIEILRYGVACGKKNAQGIIGKEEETGRWIEKKIRATANNNARRATFSKAAVDNDFPSAFSSTISSVSTEKKNKETVVATPTPSLEEKKPSSPLCKQSRSLVKIDYRPSFPIECCDKMIQADFANEWLGGGTLRYGCVQEEILFAIKPELITGMLLCERMREHEVVLISGARQFSEGSGYANGFRFAYGTEDGRSTCTASAEEKKQNTQIVSVEIEDAHFLPARRNSGQQHDADTADALNACGPRGGAHVLYHSFVNNNNDNNNDDVGPPTRGKGRSTTNKKTTAMTLRSSFKMVNNSVVAFDALNFHQHHPMQQYTTRAIDRELIKAFAAVDAPCYSVLSSLPFVSASAETSSVQTVESPPVNGDGKHKTHRNEQCLSLTPFATGGWGCGVFAGHHPLKFLIQWVAASLVGREMTFCALGSDLQLKPVRDLHGFLSGDRGGSSLDLHSLYSRILAFNSSPQGRAAAKSPQAEHALVSQAFTDWMLSV